jgi:hypothetical protein
MMPASPAQMFCLVRLKGRHWASFQLCSGSWFEFPGGDLRIKKAISPFPDGRRLLKSPRFRLSGAVARNQLSLYNASPALTTGSIPVIANAASFATYSCCVLIATCLPSAYRVGSSMPRIGTFFLDSAVVLTTPDRQLEPRSEAGLCEQQSTHL